jgi:uracil-DNA glycosylase family 4
MVRRFPRCDVDFVAADSRNPFGMSPSCERYVPGYGSTTADFHVVGHHPGVHGGLASGIPFTGRPWSECFFDALARGGLVERTGDDVTVRDTFLSYLHMCLPEEGGPTAESYSAMASFFDAELRAITAHVLVPVGARATAHVFESYTARDSTDLDMDALHATEIRGSGWLVVPVKTPAVWTDGDADRLADALVELRRTDYRQESDLGRFFPGDDPYLVR